MQSRALGQHHPPNRHCGNFLLKNEFRDNLRLRENLKPLDMPQHCDGCGERMTIDHALACKREAWSPSAMKMWPANGAISAVLPSPPPLYHANLAFIAASAEERGRLQRQRNSEHHATTPNPTPPSNPLCPTHTPRNSHRYSSSNSKRQAMERHSNNPPLTRPPMANAATLPATASGLARGTASSTCASPTPTRAPTATRTMKKSLQRRRRRRRTNTSAPDRNTGRILLLLCIPLTEYEDGRHAALSGDSRRNWL